jgi:hypothetical protein
MTRNIASVANNSSLNITFRMSILDYEPTIENFIYEPYTNVIPSPNPDYPQNIQVVTGNNEVSIVGKNLFDKTDNIESGKYYDNITG